MNDVMIAFGIWLPLGTIVPLLLARFTGSDWRGALIEASLFATMGLLIFPILIGLTYTLAIEQPNVNMVFAVSYLLAIGSVLIFRRQSNQARREARRGHQDRKSVYGE